MAAREMVQFIYVLYVVALVLLGGVFVGSGWGIWRIIKLLW